jgi:hypothetical protein
MKKIEIVKELWEINNDVLGCVNSESEYRYVSDFLILQNDLILCSGLGKSQLSDSDIDKKSLQKITKKELLEFANYCSMLQEKGE